MKLANIFITVIVSNFVILGTSTYLGIAPKVLINLLNIENNKFNVVVNVKNFGARGDGVTDDSQSINKAINFVYLKGGGVVQIPYSNKEYLFTEIFLKSNVELRGTGGVLKYKSQVALDKERAYYPINNLGHKQSTFNNLIIDGNGRNNTLFKVCDVITCVGNGSKVINCYIKDAPDSGIMISGTPNGDCTNNYLIGGRDCGIYVNSPIESPNAGTIVRENVIKDYVVTGIGIKRASILVNIQNNYIYNCGNGITIEDFSKENMGFPKKINIKGNYINKIGYYKDSRLARRGISISRGDSIIIENNIIENCKGLALYCNNTSNSLFHNNYLFSNDFSSIELRGEMTGSYFLKNISNSKVKNYSNSNLVIDNNIVINN